MVGHSWVKAHVRIPGKELTNQQAKLAITFGEELLIPAPYSHLKCLLKNYIVKNGINIRIAMIQPRELGRHGAFPSYFHRFEFLDSPHYICGMLGDADHSIYSCSLTKEFHLIKPVDEHKKVWFNLLTNRQAVTKIEGAFRTSRNICDTLNQERDHN
ncbi:hypothetical protein AVEN_16956-1 [Araneus ventricosus]|uniref:RNase H type-1 domain-containing protein n=1 Tax=Araneus ventricosus TaxID=182803 RepID=A0A4Y2D6C9_ARAVE|nr:hypothetical protein AVEN_16956-1 [Araneus ventricosus]